MEAPKAPLVLHKPTVSAKETTGFQESHMGNVVWQTLLDSPHTGTDSMCAGIATCPANGSLALHKHAQAEMYYILDGSGEVEIGGERHKVTEGSMLWVPGDVEHGVFCGPDETLRWLYVFPEGRFDNIVYRFKGHQF
ncbi:cupin domain-containing protein [Sarocladium implicatum]|nr:cupin domain-containing protein [Sarocladium implicatum]